MFACTMYYNYSNLRTQVPVHKNSDGFSITSEVSGYLHNTGIRRCVVHPSEILIHTNRTTSRHTPEECNFDTHYAENLNSKPSRSYLKVT